MADSNSCDCVAWLTGVATARVVSSSARWFKTDKALKEAVTLWQAPMNWTIDGCLHRTPAGQHNSVGNPCPAE